MKFNNMSIDELRAYKACVEVYGTSAELVEIVERMRELENVE